MLVEILVGHDLQSHAIGPNFMIRLDQFLKLTGLFETGGQAKLAIQGGEVRVNGEIETRRRRQLHHGDVVSCFDEEFEVTLDQD